MKKRPDQSPFYKAVSAGERAAHMGLPVEVNPSPAGDLAKAWARGWRAASEARFDHDHRQPPLKPTTPSAFARSGTRGLPPRGRGTAAGSRGLMIDHSALETRGEAMPPHEPSR